MVEAVLFSRAPLRFCGPPPILGQDHDSNAHIRHASRAYEHTLRRPRILDNGRVQRPQLIASDVDGTLLDPLEQLDRRTRAVIARALAVEVPFVLASGRPPRWIPRVAWAAGVCGFAVCANGAIIYDIASDAVVTAHTVGPMLLNDVASSLDRALPDGALAVERPAPATHTEGVPHFVIEHRFSNPWGDSASQPGTRAEILGHPAVKLLVSDPHMRSAEMAIAARAVLDDTVDVTFSTNDGLIEIAARGISKGTGLAEVADRLGIEADTTIAFGDMPNDLDMLRWAGHGVAMANADPTVRDAADEITAPNTEQGVAQVLERWF